LVTLCWTKVSAGEAAACAAGTGAMNATAAKKQHGTSAREYHLIVEKFFVDERLVLSALKFLLIGFSCRGLFIAL
jgi:hypothetical protein